MAPEGAIIITVSGNNLEGPHHFVILVVNVGTLSGGNGHL